VGPAGKRCVIEVSRTWKSIPKRRQGLKWVIAVGVLMLTGVLLWGSAEAQSARAEIKNSAGKSVGVRA
jgi:hypothetical protein